MTDDVSLIAIAESMADPDAAPSISYTAWAPVMLRLVAELERQKTIRALVDEQAEDDGLWFRARTAPEAYLQQELRKLHELIEQHAPRTPKETLL